MTGEQPGTEAFASHRRFVVIGVPGSGKTIFSRSLARALGSEHIDLDTLCWGPEWTRLPDFRSQVEKVVPRDSWVIDGNHVAVRDLVWPRAQAVVWLDYALPVVFLRGLERSIHRVSSGDGRFQPTRWMSLLRGGPEGVPWWIIRTYRSRRREYRRLLSAPHHSHLVIYQPRRPSEAEELLRFALQGAEPIQTG